ncbi:glycoside hydrolase family 19 protein [Rhizobium leguminosarum]|uniref:glycoside hydrolase family 19 protein n=1 Tax=Rhizobium leguminosarum TaxID=384 RepID=UPI00035DC972|nr:pyocin R, lytic enzyme [Rhizobium leguminosarum]
MNIDDLKRFAPGGKPVILAGLSAGSDDLHAAGIDTPLRICHFMAQIAHESDGFHTMTEYASGAAYEGRDDLGNSEPGDGRKFKGHGLIQTTGRTNHREFTAWATSHYPGCPDFEKTPEQLAQMPWALRSAIWYWTERGLNRCADKNDIRAITRRINGGYNGLADRRAWFRKAVAIWGEGGVSEIGGKGVASSNTGRAALLGGGVSIAGLGSQAYEVSNLVNSGRDISDAIGIPLITLVLFVAVLGLLVYIFWDRLFLSKWEGL